jgi:AcrR family transcriptional regulator
MNSEGKQLLILNAARSLFYTYGYSKVTMSDIAREMGMSKKTLYKFFNSKQEIIIVLVKFFKEEVSAGVEKILGDEQDDFPVKMKKMLQFVALRLSGISNVFLEDLQKYLPEVWEDLNNYKKEAAFTRFKRLIDEGKAKNRIRNNINPQMIVLLYASAVQNLLDPAFYKQIPTEMVQELPVTPALIFDNIINIIYHGILDD